MAAPRVELIYDSDCPNIAQARVHLLRAFGEAGLSPSWTEWSRQDAHAPAYVLQFGSPAVLVNGEEVTGLAPASRADSCRLYVDPDGRPSGAPSVQAIARALEGAGTAPEAGKRAGFAGMFAVGPGVLTAFLAKAACPFCYPALAGLFTSVGLGFLLEGSYLHALAAGLVLVTLFGLGYRARSRRGYRPLGLGLVSALVLLVGKLGMDSDIAFYAGAAGLALASLWNLIPRREPESGPCLSCAPAGTPSPGA